MDRNASEISGSRIPDNYAQKQDVVGNLCRNLPNYARQPPIEAVVFGFGTNEDWQLGVDSDASVLVPKVVEALLGTRWRGRSFLCKPVVGGSRNTVAIDAEGQVLSWGWGSRGTLGHGQRATERKPRRLAALKGVTLAQAAIGGWHCLAVSEAGQVYAWGGNEYGQCGVDFHLRDVVQPTACLPGLRVQQVAAGGMHSCVLTDTGEVWIWGEPWGDFSMKVDRRPRRLEGAVNIAKIACGAFHNMALTREGTVSCWGINDFGQLGNGSTAYATSPTQVVGLEEVPVADISAGGWHSLALSASGEVWVWGRGEYGRLGLGDRSGSSRLRPARVEGLERHCVVQAACGGTHTLVLTAEGRMFTWGRGQYGRLGTGAEKDCYSPVEVLLPGGPDRWHVVSVTAGGRHSMALAVPDNDSAANGNLTHRTTFRNRNDDPDARQLLAAVSAVSDEVEGLDGEIEAGSSDEEAEGQSEPAALAVATLAGGPPADDRMPRAPSLVEQVDLQVAAEEWEDEGRSAAAEAAAPPSELAPSGVSGDLTELDEVVQAMEHHARLTQPFTPQDIQDTTAEE